jgi:polyhydroxybutyrate depolymerase
MRVRHLLLPCAATLLLAALAAAKAPPPTVATTAPPKPAVASALVTTTWTVGGVERQALVYTPRLTPGIAVAKRPLIFGFHGHGGTMQGAAQQMHFETLWPTAVVVYPQGLNAPSGIDPQGLHSGWQMVAGDQGDRDLAFFDAMLADVRQKYPIDERRVYTAGFSNGAIFSYLLWSTRAPELAAIGACAGFIVPPTALKEARPVVHIAGKNDSTAKFASQLDAIATDRQVDHAMAAGQSCGQRCTRYASTTQTPVVTYIHDGGHVYPPWASAAIIEFFQAHQQP